MTHANDGDFHEFTFVLISALRDNLLKNDVNNPVFDFEGHQPGSGFIARNTIKLVFPMSPDKSASLLK